MDLGDSQLSDLIRQSKMIDSQDIETNTTQELSQNTFQKIVDGVITPIMSQRSEDLLKTELKSTPGLDGVFMEIMRSENLQVTKNNSSFDLSLSHVEPARHTGLRRRTPRIQDNGSFQPIIEQDLMNMEISNDMVCGNEESSLLNESIQSLQNTTFSQIPGGSQTFEYLRVRTELEQENRNKIREEEKMMKKMIKLEQEVGNRISECMTQRVTPVDCNNYVHDSFTNKEIEESISNAMNKFGSDHEQQMDINICEEKAKKSSDLAFMRTNDAKHLWVKMKCSVPIQLKWKVHLRYKNVPMKLRIRLVNYTARTDIGKAIRDPTTDVVKCRNHIEEETLNPAEAFFYLLNSKLKWTCQHNNAEIFKGYHFVTTLAPGMTEVRFDIIFMCQKMCMGIEDKRKSTCLAVFLEDENGEEILHTVIEKVYIVAYPRRDRRNFLEKQGQCNFSENSSSRPFNNTSSKFEHYLPSVNLYQEGQKPSDAVLNASNTHKMLPSTSNSRKRAASDNNHARIPSDNLVKPIGYAMRLHGCQPKGEGMDYESDTYDFPESPAPKKYRPTYYPHKTLVLSDIEYAKVVNFLAKEAEETQINQTSTLCYPKMNSALINMKPSDGIDKFLVSINEGLETERFREHGIHTVSDLTRLFGEQYNVFEMLGVVPSKLKMYYEVFLSYYRIQERNLMKSGIPGSRM